jgi:peptide-methionine (R)-S-oxide reductase
MHRRTLLATGVAALAMPLQAAEGSFEVTRTEAEWRAMLTPLQFRVMREEGTERAGTSPLDRLYDPGTYHCRGCDLAVYSSETKFDSGTGWPSFWASLPGAVGTREDRRFFMRRTECHCRRCGSHFGHIFDDGPPPTGKRHCLNGASLVFRPA